MNCPECRFSNPPLATHCEKCGTSFPQDEGATDIRSGMEGWSAGVPEAGAPATTGSTPLLQPGSVLTERYEILELLGEGGMGAVYKARDRAVDRLVALKVLHSQLAWRPEILQRFKQELILARQVTHQNVIRIFDLGMAHDLKFITMEYVEGQDLASLLSQRGKFTPEESARIIQQVCRALNAAHSAGVIHRDLKPQNIMMGTQGRVLVMDFGIARSAEMKSLTQTGQMIGTPEYMSPEQAKGEKVDHRTDLYAAGLIFYELLLGKMPYKANTARGSLLKRMQEQAVPPAELDPTIPRFMSDLVVKCLQIDPERRYQSAVEILQDLEARKAPRTPEAIAPSPAKAIAPSPAEAITPPPAPPSSGMTGQLPAYVSFGNRYEILELLGEGGMGRVYKAWDRELEKLIALKTVRSEMASNPELVKRFKQELLLARKITHKNVIRIHDLGEAEGVRFFTMEYIHGESLKHLVERQGKISAEEVVPLVKQMLGALEEAHSQGVIHRDLKPENIMIDQEGVLYIMDFGIARSAQDTGGMTATGAMIGTPDYMSPEQVRGQKADAQSDIFSFGVILYKMLTGELPYQGDTAASRVMMRLSKSPRPPSEIHSEIPKYLESIVVKCLDVDRELRYKNAKEVLADLEREQVDRSPLMRLKRAAVRNKAGAAVAVALVIAVAAAVYYAATGAPSTAQPVPVTTLAILPFTNASGDPALDWIGPSLAQILITEIGQADQLQTVSSARLYQILNDLRIPADSKF
ncbi:MAG: protein kinase, partial [Vicinamibacteria bacterium]